MQRKRFDELEGLRGVAAVVVAIFHFLMAFYLIAFFGSNGGLVQHSRFEDNFYGSIFATFLSGTFAVAIFFVLSGFVLSIGFFQSGKLEVIKKLAAKRYFRLMIPALVSTIICFLIISIGVSKIQEAGHITGSSWLLEAWTFSPTFFDAIKSGIYDIFVTGSSPFNNVLWTMTVEFAGSFLVFGYLALFGNQKHRWISYVALLLITFNTWFFAFIAGMILADIYARGLIKVKTQPWLYLAPLLLVVLWLGGYPVMYGESAPLYAFLTQWAPNINWKIMLITIGAILLLVIVLSVQQITNLFANKKLSILGKYTFSLYLTHLPVIYTVGLASFLVFYNIFGLSYHISVLGTFIICVPITTAVTILFEKYVDSPSVVISSKFSQYFLGNKGLPSFGYKIGKKWQLFTERKKIKLRRQLNEVEEIE